VIYFTTIISINNLNCYYLLAHVVFIIVTILVFTLWEKFCTRAGFQKN